MPRRARRGLSSLDPVRKACWPRGVCASPLQMSVGSFAMSVGPRGRLFASIAGPHTPVFARLRRTVRKPLQVRGVPVHRKPPEVRSWSLGAGRGALTSPFPHPRVETVHATFTAHGSPGIGDFRSQRYHWVCQVPRVRCYLHRLTGRWMALKFIRDKTVIGPAPRPSPGVLPHVRSFPALRVL
jgi:hypothetical protein